MKYNIMHFIKGYRSEKDAQEGIYSINRDYNTSDMVWATYNAMEDAKKALPDPDTIIEYDRNTKVWIKTEYWVEKKATEEEMEDAYQKTLNHIHSFGHPLTENETRSKLDDYIVSTFKDFSVPDQEDIYETVFQELKENDFFEDFELFGRPYREWLQ